jgi:hypothetical protein
MKDLEEILKSLVGRTIDGCGTDDDELMLQLDDGRIIWIWSEEDELFLTINSEDATFGH